MTMKLRRALMDFARIVVEEAEHNPEFGSRLRGALDLKEDRKAKHRPRSGTILSSERTERRGQRRRPPAILDPIELARVAEDTLRHELAALTVEQLKDVVADYGMDPGKLVMKWKSSDKIIARIVEVSVGRARRGDAFRS